MLFMRRWIVLGLVSAMLLACSGAGSKAKDQPSDAGVACVDDAGNLCVCGTENGQPVCLLNGQTVASCDCASNPNPGATSQSDAGADPLAAFTGHWAMTGTHTVQCAADAGITEATELSDLIFFPEPDSDDAGQGDLIYTAGIGCSLQVSVTGNTARLASAPQTCSASALYPLVFTSVEVTLSGPSAGTITETYSLAAPVECEHTIQGILGRTS